MKKIFAVLCALLVLAAFSVAGAAELAASPEWVTKLPQAKTANQLFVVAGVGKTTAGISLHEKDQAGEWHVLMTTPGFIGKGGLGKTKEGDAKTPTGDLDGQDRGCERCPEQGRKGGTHTTHDDALGVRLLEVEKAGETVADAAADLKGGSLTSGGAAEHVGQDCPEEDQRCHPQRDLFSLPDRLQNGIGASVLREAEPVVGQDDHNAGSRKAIQELRVRCAQLRAGPDRDGEDAGDGPDDGSAEDPEQDPFGRCPQRGGDALKILMDSAGDPAGLFLCFTGDAGGIGCLFRPFPGRIVCVCCGVCFCLDRIVRICCGACLIFESLFRPAGVFRAFHSRINRMIFHLINPPLSVSVNMSIL